MLLIKNIKAGNLNKLLSSLFIIISIFVTKDVKAENNLIVKKTDIKIFFTYF